LVTADYYYPDLACLVDFFAISGLKIVGIAGDETHSHIHVSVLEQKESVN